MEETEYDIEMYSLERLDKSLRVNFRLPGSPYKNEEAVKILKNLGVVFFRDNRHSHGVLIEPGGDPLKERRGFTAFYHRVICDEEDCEPQIWGREEQIPGPPTVEDYEKKHGDDRAWLLFNDEKHILKMTDVSVQVS